MSFLAILLFASTIAVIYTYVIVSKRIVEEKEFSGKAWGLLNGVTGIGILWVIIMHASLNKKIDGLNNKKYIEYARKQMRDFVKVYGICFGIYIGIRLLMFVLTINTP